MTIRPGRMMSNSLARQLYAGRDPGKACLHCRFFDESRGTELAICRRHKIRTNIAAVCGEYEKDMRRDTEDCRRPCSVT